MTRHISTAHRVRPIGHDAFFPHAPSPGANAAMRSSAFGETNPIFSSKPNGRGSCLVRFCGFRAETNRAFADDREAIPGSATMFAKRTLLVFYNDINVRPSRLVSYRSQPERPVHFAVRAKTVPAPAPTFAVPAAQGSGAQRIGIAARIDVGRRQNGGKNSLFPVIFPVLRECTADFASRPCAAAISSPPSAARSRPGRSAPPARASPAPWGRWRPRRHPASHPC